MHVKVDRENRFISMFNPDTGFYVRTSVREDRKDTGIDPFMANYPELLDIGISGKCEAGKLGLCKASGIECYQSGATISKPHMTLDNFKRIIDESKGKVFQVALGGRGDPDQHPDFEAILRYCRENNIVPNFTTSGIKMTPEKAKLCKTFCGACAVSEQRAFHTKAALGVFLKAEVKTNLHYVLGNNTINEAINRLNDDSFARGINAVIFLLHKPVGLGSKNNVLKVGDPRLEKFFTLITEKHPYKIGFDSCSASGIINYSKGVNPNSMDTCEGARFSAYISSEMIMSPCSFDREEKWGFDLNQGTIQDAWNSPQFEDFRNHLKDACPNCKDREACMGGCPIKNEIVLCNRTERSLK